MFSVTLLHARTVARLALQSILAVTTVAAVFHATACDHNYSLDALDQECTAETPLVYGISVDNVDTNALRLFDNDPESVWQDLGNEPLLLSFDPPRPISSVHARAHRGDSADANIQIQVVAVLASGEVVPTDVDMSAGRARLSAALVSELRLYFAAGSGALTVSHVGLFEAAPCRDPAPRISSTCPECDSAAADQWIAAHPTNFTVGRSEAIQGIILHTTEGDNTVAYFSQNSAANVSAHYVIERTGLITQMANEADTAWHTSGLNASTIGIEHSACANLQCFPAAQLEASVAVTCGAIRDHGLSTQSSYDDIVQPHSAHSSMRSDPGPYWPWECYLGAVAQCVSGDASWRAAAAACAIISECPVPVSDVFEC